MATIQVTADITGTAVATLVVEVTAPDIAPALVFNIPIAGGVASGSIVVPAGSARIIRMRAYDAAGVQTDSGSALIAVHAGTNPTISVVLQPLAGDVPISVTLGSLTVTVTPSADTLALGQTVILTVSIKDPEGSPLAGSVAWATRDPGVAIVDGNGLVSTTGVGSTTISATFAGATGVAAVTVTP